MSNSEAKGNTPTIIAALQADRLLQGSYILTQIENLKANLRYKTEGEFVSFDDMFISLENQVDRLSKLKLAPAVATGTENHYIIKLIESLEEVLNENDRVGQKVIHFEGKLLDAASQIRKVGSAFSVWYTLAAADVLTANYGDLVISMSQLKDLAASEFSRLMENLDTGISSLISAVKATTNRLKLTKKTQQEKFDLGKDQANASWTSQFPSFGNTVSGSGDHDLVEHPDEEVAEIVEEVEEVVEPVEEFIESKGGNQAKLHSIVYQQAKNGGVETVEGIPVVRAGADGLPKIVLSDTMTMTETFSTPFPQTLTVATIPEEQYDALKEAVSTGPVSAEDFASMLSDEPVTKAPKEKKERKSSSDKVVWIPAPGGTLTILRTKEDQPDKIKCLGCDRRIRIGQRMWERDGGWQHLEFSDCTGAPKEQRESHRPTGVMGQITDITHEVMRKAEDTPPATKPLEEETVLKMSTIVPNLSTVEQLPVLSAVEPLPIESTTIVAQMMDERSKEAKQRVETAETLVMNSISELIEEASQTMSPEEFKAAETGFNSVVDAAIAKAAPVVENIPPRRKLAFLEDDGSVI